MVRDLNPKPEDDDDRLILTAAHVVLGFPEETAMLYAPPGPEPSLSGGRPCGTLRRRVPLYHLPTIGVDAAVVKPIPTLACSNEMECGGPNGIRDLFVLDDEDELIAVRKHGAQTLLTTGELIPITADLEVEDVRARYNVGWWAYGNGTQFAAKGDSGSIVVDDARRVLGMVVAVNREDGAGFVHGIKQIFSALQITL
jgi:hypothetical protein